MTGCANTSGTWQCDRGHRESVRQGDVLQRKRAADSLIFVRWEPCPQCNREMVLEKQGR